MDLLILAKSCFDFFISNSHLSYLLFTTHVMDVMDLTSTEYVKLHTQQFFGIIPYWVV